MKLTPDELETLKDAAIQAEVTNARAAAAKSHYEAVIAKLSFIHKVDLSTVPVGRDGTIHEPMREELLATKPAEENGHAAQEGVQ